MTIACMPGLCLSVLSVAIAGRTRATLGEKLDGVLKVEMIKAAAAITDNWFIDGSQHGRRHSMYTGNTCRKPSWMRCA